MMQCIKLCFDLHLDALSLIRFSLASPSALALSKEHLALSDCQPKIVYTEMCSAQQRIGMQIQSLVPRVKIAVWTEQRRRGAWTRMKGGFLKQLPCANRAGELTPGLENCECFPEHSAIIFHPKLKQVMLVNRHSFNELLIRVAGHRHATIVGEIDVTFLFQMLRSDRWDMSDAQYELLSPTFYEAAWLEVPQDMRTADLDEGDSVDLGTESQTGDYSEEDREQDAELEYGESEEYDEEHVDQVGHAQGEDIEEEHEEEEHEEEEEIDEEESDDE
eukprot:TRINITY_DN58295_c0_g1_i1.p1 TRINITY_DN58295_c0_g1~~TRINITY_DN58295_c0_g1_i1.p1  ORF type:complete len:275 (+),score=50.45 TRINITY_DN58295_c0_g1_i1:56-880(+)